MRTPLWRLDRLAAAAAVLAACSGDPPTAPRKPADGPVGIHLTISSQRVTPGEDVTMQVGITAPSNQAVSDARLLFSGLVTDTLLLPPQGMGNYAYEVNIHIPNGPFEGTISVLAIARIGTVADSARTSFDIYDDGVPDFRLLQFNTAPEPGDTMRIGFIVDDVSGVSQMSYHIHGAMDTTGGSTFTLPDEVATQLSFYVPRSVRLGDSIVVDMTVKDAFGRASSRSTRAVAADRTPPTLTAALGAGRYDTLLPTHLPVLFTGDTLTMTAQGLDHFRLAWVGWRIEALGLGDSVGAADTVQAGTWRLPVSPAMDGPGRVVTLFARDSAGNVTARPFDRDFVDGTRRAFDIAGPTSFQPPGGWAYSPQRGRALVMMVGSVLEFSVAPFAYLGSVSMTTNGFGVDVAPGGDTAWGGSNFGAVVRIPLTGPPASAGSLGTGAGFQAFAMRVLSNGRIMFTGPGGATGDAGYVPILDPATGAAVHRPVTGFSEMVTASGDRSVAVGYNGTGSAMTYHVASDSFGVRQQVAPGTPTLNRDGSLVLIGNRLYDDQLHLVRVVGSASYSAAPSLLSDDGQYAYFSIWPGYHKVRVSDGALIEKVWVPEVTAPLMELPDRNQFLVMARAAYYLMDLSPAGVLPARRRR